MAASTSETLPTITRLPVNRSRKPIRTFAAFVAKVAFFAWLFIWVRWTLPRFRYDQLMALGWKIMIPLGLANLVVTALVVALVVRP